MAANAARSKTVSINDIMPDLNTRFAYVLAVKNDRRGNVYDENGRPRNEIEYKPYLNVLLRSSIVWDGGLDPFSGKERVRGRHQIRYYDGCTTIFVDDQPKEKSTIDALVLGTRDVIFTNGHYFVFGYDSMLKIYMDWCSYNEDSPYRVPTVEVKFKSVNNEKESDLEAAQLELEDEVNELAKNTPFKKLKIHAAYLGLADQDDITNQPLSEKVMRTEYRKYAKANPLHFKRSFNDKTIEITTWITDALNSGKIDTVKRSNAAIWGKGEAFIMDLSGIKSQDLIIQKLVEFTTTDDGADFLAQLKNLYS